MASIIKREWTDAKTGKTKSAYAVRWKEGAQQRSQGGFALKKQAQEFKLHIEVKEQERKRGGFIEPIAIRTAIHHFLCAQELRVKDGRIGPRFLLTLKNSLDNGITPYIGDLMTDAIKPYQVEDVYSRLRKIGNAPTTARMKLQHFQLVCDFAIRRGWMARNIAKDAIKTLRGIPAVQIETFDLKQIQSLLLALESHGKEINSPKVRRSHAFLDCAVHLAMFCGLRFGEIAGLKAENIDLIERTVRVRHSLCEDGTIKGPKTRAGYREVPIPQPVALRLADYVKRFYIKTDAGLLFTNSKGEHIKASNFHVALWRPLLVRAGLRKDGKGAGFHFHALRHFAASWMVARGMPLTDTAAMLGHSRFDMTLQVYAHPLGDLAQRRQMLDGAATMLLEQETVAKAPLALPKMHIETLTP